MVSVDAEKCQLEQRLQEANRALDLADSHLKQEIEKIKTSLEQKYTRLYERDQKQHQHELHQLRQQLISPTNNSLEDIEEIKKMYRIEIDRLYRKINNSFFFFFHLIFSIIYLKVKILN